MSRLRMCCAALGVALLYAGPAGAAAVDVAARTKAGAPAADVLVVFDPLDATPAPDHNWQTIDQVNKRFVPRVTIIRTGTSVSFPNSDSIRHEVYSFSKPHPFKLKLYASSPRVDVTFDKPGMVILGCNIHDTMVGFVAVVDTPYFAKTSPAGTAEVNLPPGRYRVRVWHEKMTAPADPRELKVAGDPVALPLTLDVDPSHEGSADWPN